jgi:cbb3-type cytochrome oxidase subunit 1
MRPGEPRGQWLRGRDMTETLQLRGRFAGVNLDELVDSSVVRTWLYWGMFWLMITPSVGVTISGLFNYPDYLGTTQLGLTFGRLRPIHVNGVIMGAFSSLFIGECIIWCRACVAFAWSGDSWACRQPGCGIWP